MAKNFKIPVHTIAKTQVVGKKYGEMLDWWTEEQYVFTIGKIAKVTDLSTGKSFNIKRTIGANHADFKNLKVTTLQLQIHKIQHSILRYFLR